MENTKKNAFRKEVDIYEKVFFPLTAILDIHKKSLIMCMCVS